MTYREIIYQVLDLSKLLNDDITINEEHVKFLIDKFRAALLWQKYKSIKLDVQESNYQSLCLDLEVIENNNCDGETFLRSACIPKLMEIGNTVVSPMDFYHGLNMCFIDKERMRYAGSNPLLKNIIYCSINSDGRLYVKSHNPQLRYLKQIKLTGIFEESIKASNYECDNCNTTCEPIDRTIPLEEALATTLIEAIVKEVVGAAWRPADQQNNANDDLSDLATFISKNSKSNLQKQIEA